MSHWYLHPYAPNFFTPWSEVHKTFDVRVRKTFSEKWVYYNFPIKGNAPEVSACVCYVNVFPTAPLNSIRVVFNSKGIHLYFDSANFGTLPEQISTWAVRQDLRTGIKFKSNIDKCSFDYIPYCKLLFPQAIHLQQFIELLPQWNHQFSPTLFSDELIQELRVIARYCRDIQNGQLLPYYEHQLPVLPETYELFGTGGEILTTLSIDSQQHDEMMLFDDEPFKCYANNRKNINKLLSQGDNPNQACIFGYNALDVSSDPEVFEILLIYGTDAKKRKGIQFLSTFEREYRKKPYVIKLNILIAFFSKPTRSVQLQNLTTYLDKDRVITEFDCVQQKRELQEHTVKLQTALTTHLNRSEENEILVVCRNAFKMKDDHTQMKLTQSVIEDLHKPGRMLEFIYDRASKKLRGFIIFEWKQLSNQGSPKRMLYCSLSWTDPQLREMEFIPLLLWRTAYALGVDLIGFLAVTWRSFRLAKDLFYPKYQAPHLEGLVSEFLSTLDIQTFIHDGLKCYASNQLMPREDDYYSLEKKDPDVTDCVFYREFLDAPIDNTGNIPAHFRGMPAVFYLSELSYLALDKHCRNLGINLRTHIIKLGSELIRLIHPVKPLELLRQPHVQRITLKRCKNSFFQNESVDSEISFPNPWRACSAKL